MTEWNKKPFRIRSLHLPDRTDKWAMKKRNFKEGIPQHVYVRGIGGGIIFYSLEDCVFYITLYFCLSRKHGIVTYAFSLMPNHAHSQQKAGSLKSFTDFNKELLSKFAQTYNLRHSRHGPLFDKPFGSAPKSTGKLIKSNISYICNNGAEGKLSKGILDYRWNMVAYCTNSNPFSERKPERSSSRRFLRAMKLVRYCRRTLSPLDYKLQETVYKGLDHSEKKQILDLILTEYNVVDQEGMVVLFGSLDNALTAMETNCGSEHDIKEDWDNYSVYRSMIQCVSREGMDIRTLNFESMDEKGLKQLRRHLKKETGASEKQLDKFLHMGILPQQTNK